MVKCIFSLGIIDKKLFVPLLTIIVYTTYIFLSNNFALEDADIFFYYFGFSIGEVITFYVPYIFKYENNYKIKNNKKKKCTKNNIINYFFLLLINLLRKICLLYEFCFLTSDADFLFAIEAFEIIIICLITKFFLKYKYYIHHIISLAIFFILSIIMDIMIGNFNLLTTNFIIYIIIFSIFEVAYNCYIKYMIDVKYHSLYNMIFFIGISDFILILFVFGIFLIIKFEYNNKDILLNLEKYDKSKIGSIVIKFLIGLFCEGFFHSILAFQTLNLFDPNYLFVCYSISKIANIPFYLESLLDYLIIIPYIFQIIVLLFYVEIFEYNFCGLNKNTKKNILLREKEEINNNDIDKDDIIVELKDGYFITNESDNETDKKNILLPEEKKNSDK